MKTRASSFDAPLDGANLCLCLTGRSIEEDLQIVREHGRHADLLELRVDFLSAGERSLASRIPGLVRLPVILTVRRTKEGGQFAGEESERVSLLRRLVSSGFAFADLEEDLEAPELDQAARAAGCRVIRSLHDTGGVPEDLARRLACIARNRQEIAKAAVTPCGAEELRRLLGVFAETRGMAKILIGMGEVGFPTRVLAGKLGSLVSYSSGPGRNAAPGQTDPGTLHDLYRFHSIGAETAVFGVIGDPIAHTLSPLIHNRGFAALGMDAVYLPFLVDEPAPFLKAAETLDIRGFSVTIPHKQAVIPLLERRDRFVESAGACNTVMKSPTGWSGFNTDSEGFLSPLRQELGGEIPPGLKATVIGAGGASRAVVSALREHGARVLVLNRTPGRAEELARAFDASWACLDENGIGLMSAYSDLIVQTTSVGMEPEPDGDPAPGYLFTGREVAYDLVYRPAVTRFLSRARAAGCRIVLGSRMLLAQAFAQFKLFTGREYPGEIAAGLEEEMGLGSAAWQI